MSGVLLLAMCLTGVGATVVAVVVIEIGIARSKCYTPEGSDGCPECAAKRGRAA